ncbi:MAG: hypothetical protein ACJ8GO_03285 [Ramlibacter sp.]
MQSPKRAAAALCLALLAACQPQPKPEQFAGQWKSSRLATPLHLHANGDWEIRDGADQVLQYGVWQVRENKFVWTIKMDGQLQHDPNSIVSVKANSFELRERDGSITRFERLQQP